MEPTALEFMSGHLELAYHARGALITGPESLAAHLHIVKQGEVRASGGAADVVLGPGESFPLDALLALRAPDRTYPAESDTFCWELPANRFLES